MNKVLLLISHSLVMALLTVCLGLSLPRCTVAAEPSEDDTIFNSNTVTAFELEKCGDYDKSNRLKIAAANMMQAKWTVDGQKGSVLKTAIENFERRVSSQHALQRHVKYSKDSCEVILSNFPSLIAATENRTAYHSERLKRKKGD